MRIYQLLGIVLVSLILIGATATPAPPEVEEPSATSTPGASSLEHENLDKPYLQIAEDFFAMLQEDGSEMAIEASLSTNPYMRLRQDDITMLQQQYAGAERLVGSYMGYELLVETAMAGRLAYASYFVIYERQPLHIEMVFYRPQDEWIVQNLSFQANLEDEITEIGRSLLLQKLRDDQTAPAEVSDSNSAGR